MSFSINIIFSAKKADYAEAVERYRALVAPWAPLNIVYCKMPSVKGDVAAVRSLEERVITGCLPLVASKVVALSEEGRIYSSSAFALWMQRSVQSAKPIVFCIGGAYGFSADFKKKCHESLSLSPLTLPHQLALLVLTEQIYRAFTILKGHPYHK